MALYAHDDNDDDTLISAPRVIEALIRIKYLDLGIWRFLTKPKCTGSSFFNTFIRVPQQRTQELLNESPPACLDFNGYRHAGA